jgi:hypothetical protein
VPKATHQAVLVLWGVTRLGAILHYRGRTILDRQASAVLASQELVVRVIRLDHTDRLTQQHDALKNVPIAVITRHYCNLRQFGGNLDCGIRSFMQDSSNQNRPSLLI